MTEELGRCRMWPIMGFEDEREFLKSEGIRRTEQQSSTGPSGGGNRDGSNTKSPENPVDVSVLNPDFNFVDAVDRTDMPTVIQGSVLGQWARAYRDLSIRLLAASEGSEFQGAHGHQLRQDQRERVGVLRERLERFRQGGIVQRIDTAIAFQTQQNRQGRV